MSPKIKQKLLTSTAVILGVAAIVALSIKGSNYVAHGALYKATDEASLSETSLFDVRIPIAVQNIKYGFVLDDFRVVEGEFQKNEFLSDVLIDEQVPYIQIDKLVKKAEDVFDVRKLRVGKSYTLLCPKDSTQAAQYLIYEPSPFRYVVYNLQADTEVSIVENPIDTLVREASGTIVSSLWNAMIDNDLDYETASKMEDAFAWSVDFHHIQPNDKFKLIFEELFIDGERVGVGNIKAGYFKNGSKEFTAFHYEDESYSGFFDEEGRPMKKAFLKAPVKYSRISSPYNLRRFHPVLKRTKPHLGTDYAAPHGTPIYAVANGVVSRSGYTRGNGNFVKIKHDEVYSTQYLHMSKFAKGMRVGVHVKQGEVIGYVGSTGLATGPHVCFRFWKNGKQVDHRKENLPAPKPMSEENLVAYKKYIVDLKNQLEAIEYKDISKEVAAKEAAEESGSKTDP